MIKYDILEFYRGEKPNTDGLYIKDIIDADDLFLEANHTYIQWLFPNRDASYFNKDAPLLTDEVVSRIKSSDTYLYMVKKAFDRMMKFYNIDTMSAYHADFPPRQFWWVTKNNHNFFRCTRILNTLREFGMDKELKLFYDKLIKIYWDNLDVIGPLTFKFWAIAYDGDIIALD